jgi:alkylation response protein AidB-like acyl-CoA dehydrogenase
MEQINKAATAVAEVAAQFADAHDREGTFVAEGISAAKELGYLAAPVPEDLGGMGATVADMVSGQRILARACGSTALGASMHLHLVLAAAWRWRRGDAVVEKLLRRVAGEGIVLVSTGGNDWSTPSAVATPVEGGWRVSGRKIFASLSPVADVAVTFAAIGQAGDGAEVIGFGLPLSAEGVTLDETWDAAGMRGTGSHDLVLDNVFVAEAQVTARRTWGQLDRPLLVASLHAWPVIYATYLGIAEGLIETIVAGGKLGPASARLLGEADLHLRSAAWALEGVVADLGTDPEPETANFVALQQMKGIVTNACQRVAVIASELAGGGAYARRGPVDRMLRDLRAAGFHVYPPETALLHAGQHRLGLELSPV